MDGSGISSMGEGAVNELAFHDLFLTNVYDFA